MKSPGPVPFGKPVHTSPMPKAPDGKTLPAGLPPKDVALSKRHRLDSIKFHKGHAQDHMDRVKEHKMALKDGSYKGVRATRVRAQVSDAPHERKDLSTMIAERQHRRS